MKFITEFHYQDGDVGAYDDIDVSALWSKFSARHEGSHILIRRDSNAGQQLSNTLRAAFVNAMMPCEINCGSLEAGIHLEGNELVAPEGPVTVLRLSADATGLVAAAMLAFSGHAETRQFVQDLGNRLKVVALGISKEQARL